MKEKIISLLIIALLCVQLCACQASPPNPIVINKNDDTLDSLLNQSATGGCEESTVIKNGDRFESTDGSIEFIMNIQQTHDSFETPVVEVVPHNLSADDVKRVANILFEGCDFFEREPTKNPTYSKEQITKMIARWSQYSNYSAMGSLMGDSSDEYIADKVDYLKKYIEQYNLKLDTAPVENPHVHCDWSFKKVSHYNNLEAEMFGGDESTEDDVIFATVELGDVEYVFTATTHDDADYKLNTISVSLSSGVGPAEIDLLIYRAMLCRTPKPTNDQVQLISQKAQDMLDRMKLGDWVVTDTYIESNDINNISEHIIVVEAVPAFGDSRAIYGQRTPSATANDTYSAYYPVSRALFGFSANGEIIHFRLQSPIDIKKVVNPNVRTLSLDALIETAKKNLSLTDAYVGYGVPVDMVNMYEEAMQEELFCKIEINAFEYNMARINVADSEDSYYYVPTIVFKGKSNYYGKNTGTMYISSNDYQPGVLDLIWINALDGSIILG